MAHMQYAELDPTKEEVRSTAQHQCGITVQEDMLQEYFV